MKSSMMSTWSSAFSHSWETSSVTLFLVGVGEHLALVQAAFDVVALGLLGKEHGDAVLLRADGRKRDTAGLRRQNDSDLAGVEILGELVRNVLEQTGVDAVVEETVDLDDVAGQDSAPRGGCAPEEAPWNYPS